MEIVSNSETSASFYPRYDIPVDNNLQFVFSLPEESFSRVLGEGGGDPHKHTKDVRDGEEPTFSDARPEF